MAAALINNRKTSNIISIKVHDHEIIDFKLTFKDHLDYSRDKPANVNSCLTWMMPNIGKRGSYYFGGNGSYLDGNVGLRFTSNCGAAPLRKKQGKRICCDCKLKKNH